MCNDSFVEMPTRHDLIFDDVLLEHSARVLTVHEMFFLMDSEWC